MQNKRIIQGILILLLFILLLGVLAEQKNGNLVKSLVDQLNPNKGSKTLTVLKQSVVEEESAIIDVVEKVSPAVVSIVQKTVDFDPFSGPISSESGIGTGFIVDESGVILTNSHVVSDSTTEYAVVLSDDRSFDVVKIHKDPLNDIAILEIEAQGLPVVEFGDSAGLKVGQKAIAIGNALGQFSNTVTVGVVSGLARQLTATGPFGEAPKTYTQVIQTDSALNPGNSGGPLLNLYGQVIGVNVATTRGADNIGFAIPIDQVKPILESFSENGRIIRPYLGVSFVMITKDVAALRRFPEGAFVRAVGVDTPAEDSGLKRGDIITAMDSIQIDEDNPLDVVIQSSFEVGDRVGLTIDREGQTLTLQATLEESPEE